MAKQKSEQAVAETEVLRAVGTEVIQLPPAEVLWDDVTNVRPWEVADKDAETKRIAALAKDIVMEGQLQPIVARVIETGTGVEYHGIAGRRRHAAVVYAIDQLGHKDLKLNVLLLHDVTDESAYRKALTENFKRLNMSPMDMAMNIVTIRSVHGWDEDKDWSKKVAGVLGGVSRAYVTQKLKLLELPDEQQTQIHQGLLSEEAALTVSTKLKPGTDKSAIVKHATEIAKAELSTGTILTGPAAQGDDEQGQGQDQGSGQEPGDGTGTGTFENPTLTVAEVLAKKGNTAPVQERHINAAARAADALAKPEKLKRGEVIEIITQFDSSVYGHPNGAVRKWISMFESMCDGKPVSHRAFKKAFDDMTAGADQGTPEPEVLVTKADKAKGNGKGAPEKGKGGKVAPPVKAKDKAPKKEKEPAPVAEPELVEV